MFKEVTDVGIVREVSLEEVSKADLQTVYSFNPSWKEILLTLLSNVPHISDTV